MAWLSKEWSYRYPVLVPYADQSSTGNPDMYRIWLPKEWSYFWENIIPSGADIRVTDWTGTVELEYELGLAVEPDVSIIDFSDSLTTNKAALEYRDYVADGITTDLVFVWIYWGNPDAVDASTPGLLSPDTELRVSIESPSTYDSVTLADEQVPASTGDAIVECRFEDLLLAAQQVVIKPPQTSVNALLGWSNGMNIYWRATKVRGGSFYTNKYKRELQDTEIMRVVSYVTADSAPEAALTTTDTCVGGIYGVIQSNNGELLIKIEYTDGANGDQSNANLMVETYLTSTEPEFYESGFYPRSRTPRFAVQIKIVEPGP